MVGRTSLGGTAHGPHDPNVSTPLPRSFGTDGASAGGPRGEPAAVHSGCNASARPWKAGSQAAGGTITARWLGRATRQDLRPLPAPASGRAPLDHQRRRSIVL